MSRKSISPLRKSIYFNKIGSDCDFLTWKSISPTMKSISPCRYIFFFLFSFLIFCYGFLFSFMFLIWFNLHGSHLIIFIKGNPNSYHFLIFLHTIRFYSLLSIYSWVPLFCNFCFFLHLLIQINRISSFVLPS